MPLGWCFKVNTVELAETTSEEKRSALGYRRD